ncbi:MAG: chromophore lyase CpcT/CpeT [Planctomycetes bacterium]|nr:chromophore lyase CpcT/CpeT [Planctomycetota bacterium]
MSHPIRNLGAVLLVSLFFAVSCTLFDAHQDGSNEKNDLAMLAGWMTGSFSSQEQSIADPEFFDIRLQMKPIWTERQDGYWFYVEQAAASSLERPYRQRVYHVTQKDNDTFESAVYEIQDPLRFAGAWNHPDLLAQLIPDLLIERPGASILMKKTKNNSFEGSTEGKNCQSNYGGASYATSRVKITCNEIYSWDQGFNDQDEQVWGAVKEGYLFKRVSPDNL